MGDPLPQLLAQIRQARRDVETQCPGGVHACSLHRLEHVHRLTRCARRTGWPPDPLRQA